MNARHIATLLAVLTASILILSSCGRRAELETPSSVKMRQSSPETDGGGERIPPAEQPDRPFILDGLIQ